MKSVFDRVQFVVSNDHLENFERINIQPIVPFVKTILFIPPRESCALTPSTFTEVPLPQAIEKSRRYYRDDYKVRSYKSYQNLIDGHWEGGPPVSEVQIQASYVMYRLHVSSLKNLLSGKRLKATWSNTLRALINVQELRFVFGDLVEYRCSDLGWPSDYTIRCHFSDPIHREETRLDLAGQVGDALFATAMDCVVTAKVRPRTLNLACGMTARLDWKSIPGWGNFDLSRLKRFLFGPPTVCGVMEATSDTGNGENDVAARTASNVSALLHKCRLSVETFDYSGVSDDCLMVWPGNEAIHLPRLQHLKLGSGYINARNLAAWLLQMPSLALFQLSMTWMYEDALAEWSHVFDAIRDHPRNKDGICVVFDGCDGGDIHLEHNTAQYEELSKWYERVLRGEEESDPGEDLDKYLALYLSGKIGYNDGLRMLLENIP